jgi:diaminopimelate epimerase
MREGFPFWKMAGGGNDFILLDGVSRELPELGRERIRRLCRRGLSIGADGLVAVVGSGLADVKMTHWNSDGGANEFCGNGTRCAARFVFESGLCGRRMSIETGAGVLRSEVLSGGTVKVELPRPRGLARSLQLTAAGPSAGGWPSGPRTIMGDFVIVGVPHLVVELEELDSVDVHALGSALRHHPGLGEEGANVHFVRRLSDKELEIRSYERGVEGETLACGSGAAAAAYSLRLKTRGDDPVTLRTRSGIELTVRMEGKGDEGRLFWLEGDARVVYRGVITDETETGFTP